MQLHTTVIRVRDLEQSHNWYIEKLGMREVYRDLRYHLRSYSQGGEPRFTLWELPPGAELVPMSKFGSYLVFFSQTIEADRAALAERGVPVSPVEQENGLRLFWITDPDGNKLVVLQFELD